MIGHEMPTAPLAILTEAGLRLHELADELRSFRDSDVLRLPQRERGYGGSRPRAARRAVTIAHSFRRALDLELYGSAKAIASMRDHFFRSPFFTSATCSCALLACLCAEWNDRAFVLLDRASGFRLTAFQLPIGLQADPGRVFDQASTLLDRASRRRRLSLQIFEPIAASSDRIATTQIQPIARENRKWPKMP